MSAAATDSTPTARPSVAHTAATDTVVALSGGVDSALALALSQAAGERPCAVFMKNWEEDDRDGECAAAADMADAEAVCAHLGLALRAVNFAAEYWDDVFEHFLAESRAGRTPNPDVLCNPAVKFGGLADYAGDLGATRLVTGHYARRRVRADGRVELLAAVDGNKDQSYFLHRLDQRQLALARFPLGDLTKDAVRAEAARLGLPVHAKRDSTGICFVGEQPFRTFLKRWVKPEPGPVVNERGHTLGEHEGLAYYTPGQRQGLGLGGRRDGSGEPWYVAAKDIARNTLVVVQGAQHPLLYARRLHADDVHWVASEAPAMPLRVRARIRHRQPLEDCEVRPRGADAIEVVFDRPQRAIASGQYVVLYAGDVCLGGACIERALDPGHAPC